MALKLQSAVHGISWTQILGSASLAAAAPDGSLWVLSDGQAGNDKRIWHYAIGGGWTNISGMAARLSVAPDGTLYAINSGGGIYSYNGGTWTAFGGGASDITVAADGSFYVLSNGNAAGNDQAIWHYTNAWTKYPGSGVRIAASWEATTTYGGSNGTIAPAGLYILNSAGNIYYQNTDNSFVQLPGAASAIAPTTMGGVFILSYPANANGNPIYYYDLSTPGWSLQPGSGVSISTNTSNLYTVGATGAIYASPVNAKITEYSIASSSFGDFGGPNGITTGPDGAVWFVGEGEIGRLTTSGAFTEYAIPTAGGLALNIVSGPDGALWFTEFPSKIGRVTTSGVFTEYTVPTANSAPEGITAGPDGALWFTEPPSSKIGRLTTSGAFTEFYVPTANSEPWGITIGPDGALWFTEYQSSKIGRVTRFGTFTEYSTPTVISFPYAITVGPDGALWFTERIGKIGRLTTSGAFTEYLIPIAGLGPDGITAGSDGNLWFTGTEHSNFQQIGEIVRMTTSGVFTKFATPTYVPSYPESITTGPDGALWFPEFGNKIGRISPQ